MNIKIEKVRLLDDLHISSDNNSKDGNEETSQGLNIRSPISSLGGISKLGSKIIRSKRSPTTNVGNQANLDEPTIDQEDQGNDILSYHKQRMFNRMNIEEQA
jgi:hypothetical protein